MSDLAPKVERLVEITLGPVRAKDRELGNAVRAVMGAYDAKDDKGIRKAIRLLDAGLLKAKEVRSQQILRLALGVLVEAGAPPELAWPTAARGFIETLQVATRYAQLALDAKDTPSITDAIDWGGEPFKKKHPRELAAWDSLKSRALLAVACISHSAGLRAKLMKTRQDLLAAAYPLEQDVEELLFLRQIMRVLPDQTMLAIHPGQRRGFRVEVKEVTTNLELFVLLADAIVGDPKKGFLEGRRPNRKAVAALKDPDRAPKVNPEVPLPWHVANWTALAPDGSLPDARDQRPQNWIGLEEVPLDIKPYKGERVLLLQKPSMPRKLEVEASFETLTPRVTLKSKLSGAEIDSLLLEMGKAAVKVEAKALEHDTANHGRAKREWEAALRKAGKRKAKDAAARPKKR
jgi:hypothetical protein